MKYEIAQENWKEDLARENYTDKWLVLLIEKLLAEARSDSYTNGYRDGYDEGKKTVLSEVEKSFENLHEEYTVDYTNHDILKIINNLK